MFFDETEANKIASPRPAFTSFASSQFGKQNDERKGDTIISCRLFGIDLKSPSLGSAIENRTLKPANNSDNSAEGCFGNTTSAGDSQDNSGLSKDQNHEHLHLPPNEVHGKQICSTRSRTKVWKPKRESKLCFYTFIITPKTSIEIKMFSTLYESLEKVHMQGVAVGRAVDLTVLSGYDELVKELKEMFDIQEELHARNKWEIVFTDDEGDVMLMGDHPWP